MARRRIRIIPKRTRMRLKKAKKKFKAFSTTSHKARSEWFRDTAAWPGRDGPAERLIGERRRVRRSLAAAPVAADWELAGPTNIGGRMTSIVAHPTDADVLWAGAAGGGVWHSRDAGQTWRSLWHDQESLNVGSLAIDPSHPEVLYCGTGEANLSADSYPGVGLYKSLDAGETWDLAARSADTGLPVRIGVIAVDPFDSNHILLGGVGHRFPNEPASGGLAGIYESLDAGGSWRRLDFVSPFEHRCHAIVFHPGRQGTVWVTVTEQGFGNGIWRTTDGGGSWTHLSAGLPAPDRFERTSLAIAPSDPSVLYALAADAGRRVLGVFKTTDGGDSWQPIHGADAFHYTRQHGTFTAEYEVQMSYNNAIAVHPTDADHVICGGVDLHLTTDGGQSWSLVTRWEEREGNPGYAHADHHALLMPAARPGRVYDMNDGGMGLSEDGGRTWVNRSAGLACTMYYDLDVAQSNSDFFGGGAQDNGTPITVTGGADDHFDVTSGDGGWLVFDPRDENHIYSSVYNMNIFRWPGPNGWKDVSPPESDAVKSRVWMVFIAMDPSDSRTVFTGSNRVWRTRDDGENWDAVSGPLNGVVSAIEISPADPRKIYVGTVNGSIYRSFDGGDSWSSDLSGALIPKVKITRIETSPADADRLLVTVGNFGHSHVYRSGDGGLSWTDVDRGQLPDVPHRSLAVATNYPDEVYVATDVGVFVSQDFGDSWSDMTGGLPNVSIVDLVYHDGDDTLSAATYGRSIWRIKVR